MDPSLLLSYAWVLLVLVFLEGLLAADNTITAITIALSAAKRPSKNTKTSNTHA
jgi:predicted tellurium resistance membrane protein TerC